VTNKNIKPLENWIKRQIMNSPEQRISFRDYMAECLYHPEWGYYSSNREKIGREGDFYTSSYVGEWMGRILAQYAAKHTSEGASPLIISEWGGGTGRLAKQLMDALKEQHETIYERVTLYLVEHSAKHRQAQSEALIEHHSKTIPMTAEQWFAKSFNGQMIVYSNELLDAFPVYRVKQAEGQLMEIFVEWNESAGCFQDVLEELQSKELVAALLEEPIELHEGQEAEINTEARMWIKQVGKKMDKGCLITIDYGDQAEELFASHRLKGTLMCYYQHTASDEPYVRIGNQDITAHVNFTSCIRAGQEAGFSNYSFQTQRAFLVENGILDYLQDHYSSDPFSKQAKQNRAIRQLLISDQMSELFKVLVQFK
jgi:SAM-dependent MidA family methyltransferase